MQSPHLWTVKLQCIKCLFLVLFKLSNSVRQVVNDIKLEVGMQLLFSLGSLCYPYHSAVW